MTLRTPTGADSALRAYTRRRVREERKANPSITDTDLADKIIDTIFAIGFGVHVESGSAAEAAADSAKAPLKPLKPEPLKISRLDVLNALAKAEFVPTTFASIPPGVSFVVVNKVVDDIIELFTAGL